VPPKEGGDKREGLKILSHKRQSNDNLVYMSPVKKQKLHIYALNHILT